MKARCFVLWCMLLSIGTHCGAQDNGVLSGLKTRLLLFRNHRPQQTLVVQTDKGLYRPGEALWFKGYVADANSHLPSLKSLELKILLIDSRGGVLKDESFHLNNGVVSGKILLPPDLLADHYRLVAFTPEMEANGPDAIYSKTIEIARPEVVQLLPKIEFGVDAYEPESKQRALLRVTDFDGKPTKGKRFEYQIHNRERELLAGKGKIDERGIGELTILTPSVKSDEAMLLSIDLASGTERLNLVKKVPLIGEKIDLKFFPEGGNRVSGINQLLVFEVKDQLGNPIEVQGEVVDKDGNVLTHGSTLRAGLGVINLNSTKEDLRFKITSAVGRGQLISIPDAVAGSMSIGHRKGNGEGLSLILGRSPGSEESAFIMTLICNGELVWASNFQLGQAGVLNVPLDEVHCDFVEAAVFTEAGTLVGHRLVYVGRHTAPKVSIVPDKVTYRFGEKGSVKIRVTDINGSPVHAELAVSVADRMTFPTSSMEMDRLGWGLERPLPFQESLDGANRNLLDYYLIANSLKGFDWNQLMKLDPNHPGFSGLGSTIVSGRVVNAKGDKISNAMVTVASPSMQQFSARSDQHGDFSVEVPGALDKKSIIVTATDGEGKGTLVAKLHQTFREEISSRFNDQTLGNWDLFRQMVDSGYFKKNPNLMKPGAIMKVKPADRPPRDAYWKQYLNGTSNLLDIIRMIHPFDNVGGKIVFRGMNSLNAQDGALIVVDGQRLGTDSQVLTNFNPRDIEDIKIWLNPVDISRFTALNSVGVIELSTNKGKIMESTDRPAASKVESEGFEPRPIGNPKYNLCTTLMWAPLVMTDDNGEAIIPFSCDGLDSEFLVEVAGFTDKGEWLSGKGSIRVRP